MASAFRRLLLQALLLDLGSYLCFEILACAFWNVMTSFIRALLNLIDPHHKHPSVLLYLCFISRYMLVFHVTIIYIPVSGPSSGLYLSGSQKQSYSTATFLWIVKYTCCITVVHRIYACQIFRLYRSFKHTK